MITVVTGNDKLDFKVQGQRVTSTKFVRVREDHNVQVKLNEGTLKIYKPAPSPKPRVEPKLKPETKKK